MMIMYCRKDFSSMTSTTILDKIDGKFIPPRLPSPPPTSKSRTEKWRVLDFARLHP